MAANRFGQNAGKQGPEMSPFHIDFTSRAQKK